MHGGKPKPGSAAGRRLSPPEGDRHERAATHRRWFDIIEPTRHLLTAGSDEAYLALRIRNRASAAPAGFDDDCAELADPPVPSPAPPARAIHVRRRLIAIGALACASVTLAAPMSPVMFGGPLYPPAGLDMSAMDSSVNPGDDFFQHCNGAWIARATIPPDRPYVSEAQLMRERTEAQLRAIIEQAAAHAGHEPATIEAKVGAFYHAFMGQKRLEALGVRPLAPELPAIRSSRSREQLATLMGHSVSGFEGPFFVVLLDV